MNSVLLVTNAPAPYRIPLFEELQRQLAKLDLDLLVVFAANAYSRRKWEVDLSDCAFRYKILESRPFVLGGNQERTLFTYRGLWRVISRTNPLLLIVPGFSLATVIAFLNRRLAGGVPYLIWSGSLGNLSGVGSWWRTRLRRLLATSASGAIAYGSKAKTYLEHVGVPKNRVQVAVNTVDTSHFHRIATSARTDVRSSSLKVLTYVGFLNPRKNVLKLLEVVAYLSLKRKDFVLEIVGDGEDFPMLTTWVDERRLNERVRFLGFRKKEEVPEVLARSDCFLFQTDYDIWGLVLNEAMAAGLPCLASIHAGATADLIREGETGFAVDFSHKEQVGDLVEWVLDNPEEAQQIGSNAASYVNENATVARSVSGFVRAIDAVLQGLPSRQ